MNNTPRTDEQINGKCIRFEILAGDPLRNAAVPSEFARILERELNAANAIIRQQQLLDEENLRLKDRIKRLEEDLMDAKNQYAVLVADVALYEDRADRVKQLETENDEMRADLLLWGDSLRLQQRINRLEEENEALRADLLLWREDRWRE